MATRQLSAFTDLVLWLRPGFTGPSLLEGGTLRAFSQAMVATLVLWYEESNCSGEVTDVLKRMRLALMHPAVGLATSVSQAHSTLLAWSQLVKAQFDLDNQHLTSMKAHSELKQVNNSLEQLNKLVGAWMEKVDNKMQLLFENHAKLTQHQATITTQLHELSSLFSSRSLRSPVPSGPPSAHRSPIPPVPAHRSPIPPVPPFSPLEGAPPAGAEEAAAHDEAVPTRADGTLSLQLPLPQSNPFEQMMLQPINGSALPMVVTLDNKTAVEIYQLRMNSGLRLSQSDKPRVDVLVEVLNAVCKPQEQEQMATSTDFEIHQIVTKLHDRFIARMIKTYPEGHDIPKKLKRLRYIDGNSQF